jgi:hypothetical protein
VNPEILHRIALLLTKPDEYILIHRSADYDTILVSSTDKIRPASGNYADVYLPNGDTITIAKDLDAIKANEDISNTDLLEALHEFGVIEMDDNGNYIDKDGNPVGQGKSSP